MKAIASLVVSVLGRALACSVPRDGRLCVAGSWMGEMYGDNPRYFVEYLLDNTDFRVVWVGKEQVRSRLPSHPRIKFARAGSWKATWSALRARYWIVAQGPCDIGPACLRGKALLLNLWHGLAFKRGGRTRADGSVGIEKRSLKARIARALVWRQGDELGWTSIASTEGGRHLAEALPQFFSVDFMLPFGTPRNDYLIHNKGNDSLRRELKARYAKMLGFGKDKKIVLYLPTFRKPGVKTFSFYGLEGEQRERMASFADAANAVVVEKHHFLTLKSNPPLVDAAVGWNVVIDEEKSHDVLTQELLLVADVLVTDYSSAFVDYCLLGRPCIHFVYDYDEYTTSDAGLAYDIEEIAGGPVVKTLDGLCEVLRNSLASGRGEPRPGYAAMVEFEKGRACEQLCERFFK